MTGAGRVFSPRFIEDHRGDDKSRESRVRIPIPVTIKERVRAWRRDEKVEPGESTHVPFSRPILFVRVVIKVKHRGHAM